MHFVKSRFSALFFSIFLVGFAIPAQADLSKIERHEKNAQGSRVVVHNGIAYLSGEVCTHANYTAAQQMEYILANIDEQLAKVGSDKSRILSALLLFSDVKYRKESSSAWKKWVDPDNPPARMSMATTLGHPSCKIEIQITAAVDQ